MEDWKLQLGVNLYGVIHGLHIFTPSMVAQGTEAKIAATSSFAGLLNTSTLGLGAGTPYTVSKHAVTLTMEAMAHELRNMEDCQVSAHVLCPAAVASKYLDTAIELSEGDDARKTDAFRLWHSAQMNVAEYDGPILAMLLYLAAKGVASPWGATLTCAGQVIYFWGRALTGMSVLPFAPLGAMPRYFGMGCLLYSIYGASRVPLLK